MGSRTERLSRPGWVEGQIDPVGRDVFHRCSPGQPRGSIEYQQIIWSYWGSSSQLPSAVANVVRSWRDWNPDYQVRLLNPRSVRCYLDTDYEHVRAAELRSALIRLDLLWNFGGVWLDATVVLTQPLDIGPFGFRAVAISEYQDQWGTSDLLWPTSALNNVTGSGTDFVESWFLAAPPRSYIMGSWLKLLKGVLARTHGRKRGLVKANPIVYNPSLMRYFCLINSKIPWPGGCVQWAEYLVLNACFTSLYRNDEIFRTAVEEFPSLVYPAEEVGYLLPLKHGWNDSKVFEALNTTDGQQALQSTRMFKFSSKQLRRLDAELAIRGPSSSAKQSELIPLDVRSVQPGARERELKTLRLVVACYSNDASWTAPYAGSRHVYEKHQSSTMCSATMLPRGRLQHKSTKDDRFERLPNVGREAHTYLHYIVTQYDSLAPYTAFSQGSLESEHAWIRLDMRCDYGSHMFFSMLAEARERGGCSRTIGVDPDMADWSWRFSARNIRDARYKQVEAAAGSVTSRDFGDWLQSVEVRLGHVARLRQYQIWPSAFFVVARHQIRSRSRDYYARLLSSLNYSSSPVEGHYMERAWYYIFKCDV